MPHHYIVVVCAVRYTAIVMVRHFCLRSLESVPLSDAKRHYGIDSDPTSRWFGNGQFGCESALKSPKLAAEQNDDCLVTTLMRRRVARDRIIINFNNPNKGVLLAASR